MCANSQYQNLDFNLDFTNAWNNVNSVKVLYARFSALLFQCGTLFFANLASRSEALLIGYYMGLLVATAFLIFENVIFAHGRFEKILLNEFYWVFNRIAVLMSNLICLAIWFSIHERAVLFISWTTTALILFAETVIAFHLNDKCSVCCREPGVGAP